MDNENGYENGNFDRIHIKQEIKAEFSDVMMSQDSFDRSKVKNEFREKQDREEKDEKREKHRESKKDRDKDKDRDKERKKKSKRSSRDRDRSRSRDREMKRSRERRRTRSPRDRDRYQRSERSSERERRQPLKYKYWDVPPSGYEHMTPKEYKELQVLAPSIWCVSTHNEWRKP